MQYGHDRRVVIGMDKAMPSLFFRLMAWSFRKRDAAAFTAPFLDEVQIRPGDVVLDFGCGTGNFSIAAAQRTGGDGHVHACDIQPVAERYVRARAGRAGLRNVSFMPAVGTAGLAAGSVDVVLLYDVLHMISDRAGVLAELSRILRPGGFLSVSDHHLENHLIQSAIAAEPGLGFVRTGAITLLFRKRDSTGR